MIVIDPVDVRLGEERLEDVGVIAVEREAVSPIEAWGDKGAGGVDAGAFCQFVECPRVRVLIRVQQGINATSVTKFGVGEEAVLRFVAGPGASEAGQQRIAMRGVIVAVRVQMKAGQRPVRTIELLGVDAAGADPAGGGSGGK